MDRAVLNYFCLGSALIVLGLFWTQFWALVGVYATTTSSCSYITTATRATVEWAEAACAEMGG